MGYTKDSIRYDFFEDPAHGWLKVDTRELDRLGLTSKITSFSYEHKGYAFLEEDQDASTFIEAKKEQDGVDIVLRRTFTNKPSRIRSYDAYIREGQEC
jgi:hypothetical protein